jgi:hypothetical protein
MLLMCTQGTGQGKIPGPGGRLVSPPHDLPVKTLLAGAILSEDGKYLTIRPTYPYSQRQSLFGIFWWLFIERSCLRRRLEIFVLDQTVTTRRTQGMPSWERLIFPTRRTPAFPVVWLRFARTTN